MGAPSREEKEQQERRFNKIKQFLLMGNMYNFFIKYENFETLSNDTHENIIYNNLKDIISSDTEFFIKKIDEHFKNIKKFPLYDEQGIYSNQNYLAIIKMLKKIINIDYLILGIQDNPNFLISNNIDINDINDLDDKDLISYIMYISKEMPIIMSFDHDKYKYYLTLDSSFILFKRLLTPEEKAEAAAKREAQEAAAEKQAEEAAAAKARARGSARVQQLKTNMSR